MERVTVVTPMTETEALARELFKRWFERNPSKLNVRTRRVRHEAAVGDPPSLEMVSEWMATAAAEGHSLGRGCGATREQADEELLKDLRSKVQTNTAFQTNSGAT